MADPTAAEAIREQLGPTQAAHRIVALDVLRGFALLGILLVNVMSFGGVATYEGDLVGLDRAVNAFLAYGARGAFMSTFAMLFGVGFALQIARIGRAGDPRGVGFYLRRMAGLLLFGLMHALLDPGEVLVLYSLCGALLLPFRHVTSRGIILAVLILMPMPYLHTAVVTSQVGSSSVLKEATEVEDPLAWDPYRSVESIEVHSTGGFADVVSFNARHTLDRLTPSIASYVWLIVPLPLMLFGMLVGRLRILADLRKNRVWFRRSLWAGTVGGIGGRVIGRRLLDMAGREGWDPWIAVGGEVAWVLGAFFLAITYSAALLLLLQKEPWGRLLLPLRFVGRMALTNYLLQTVVCTTLFYQYGFGLFGDVTPSMALGFAAVIFACQLAASAAWLKRYRFGPAEWAWRSITYGRFLANTRPAEQRA